MALGGERDIQIIAHDGIRHSVSFVTFGVDELAFAAPVHQSGTLLIQYDGIDGSINNAHGLNLDLTVESGNSFHLVIECDVGAEVFINVYSPGGRQSKLGVNVGRLEGPLSFIFGFPDFSGDADFSNIDSIEIEIPFDKNLDLEITDFFVAVAPETSFSESSTDTPEEPSTPEEPNNPIRIPQLEFVRPLSNDNSFIDYDMGCSRHIYNTNIFSSTSSGIIIIPSFIVTISSILLAIL